MSNDMPNPPMPGSPMTGPARPSIFQAWMDALSKPNPQTYSQISRAPNASATTALLWIFLATLVQFFVSFLVGNPAENQLMRQLGQGQNIPTPDFGGRIGTIVCGAPIGAVLAVVFFALFIGVMHLIARAFGGTGTFDQLTFAVAAIVVPLNLINAVLGLLAAIPLVGLCFTVIGFLLGIYGLVLEVMAVMGVHHIGVGGASVSVLALPVGLCLCVACVVIVSLAALGPVIGNVFSSINNSLQGVP